MVSPVTIQWVNYRGLLQIATQLKSGSRFKEDSYYGHNWVLKANGDTRMFTLGRDLFQRSNVEVKVSYLDIDEPEKATTTTRAPYFTNTLPAYQQTTTSNYNSFTSPNYNSFTTPNYNRFTPPNNFESDDWWKNMFEPYFIHLKIFRFIFY